MPITQDRFHTLLCAAEHFQTDAIGSINLVRYEYNKIVEKAQRGEKPTGQDWEDAFMAVYYTIASPAYTHHAITIAQERVHYDMTARRNDFTRRKQEAKRRAEGRAVLPARGSPTPESFKRWHEPLAPHVALASDPIAAAQHRRLLGSMPAPAPAPTRRPAPEPDYIIPDAPDIDNDQFEAAFAEAALDLPPPPPRPVIDPGPVPPGGGAIAYGTRISDEDAAKWGLEEFVADARGDGGDDWEGAKAPGE